MRIALLQCNAVVGDIEANSNNLVRSLGLAAAQGADICITPELALVGYPPRDLLFYPSFCEKAEKALDGIIRAANDAGVALVLGAIGKNAGDSGMPLHNQALFIRNGAVEARYSKRLLPTYDVFDEARYFEPGVVPCVVEFAGRRLALTICEDIWRNRVFRTPVPEYPVEPLSEHPPFDVLVNLSASPFAAGKHALRRNMLNALARKYAAHILYVNAVGGNDDLIFDGRSVYVLPDGSCGAQAKSFAEDVLLVDLDEPAAFFPEDAQTPEEEIWRALTLGVGDYCAKTGQSSAVVGLSGGVDSSLTAAIAVNALGADNVLGLLMPSPYSSEHSLADAHALAENLGIAAVTLPIEPVMTAYTRTLAGAFVGKEADVTEENLQARIRGNLLMAFSNKFGKLLLTTGNKSEISVGYCTIYGDMCGALAVIGDLYKTEVFQVCRWLNSSRPGYIPEHTILKPPSAELRPNQTDQDSLPPYEELDAILKLMLEERCGVESVAARGYSRETALRVARMVGLAEFKRRQSAPVLKITYQAFGVGWRMPIACKNAYAL